MQKLGFCSLLIIFNYFFFGEGGGSDLVFACLDLSL